MPTTVMSTGNVGKTVEQRKEGFGCSIIPIANGIYNMENPRKLWSRIAVTILFWSFGVLMNNMSATIAGRRFIKGTPPLPDIGFMHLPHIGWRLLPDLYYIMFAGYSIVRLLIMRRDGIVIFMRIFLIMGAELIVRAVVVNSTLLPDPYPPCVNYKPHITSYAPFELQCGDVLFSGHTAAWSIISFMWVMHSERTVDKVLGVMATVCGGLVLIATRYHYTVDVLIGAYVGVTMCIMYYSFARLINGGDVRKSCKLFKFFEEPCLIKYSPLAQLEV
jgi:hypothetical protein